MLGLRAYSFALGFVVATGSIGCSAPADRTDSDEVNQGELREVVTGPSVKSTDAEVWTVENQWADKSTRNAKKAGVAWPASSGLTWEEKYAKWIGAFEKVPGHSWWSSSTIRIPTPYGERKLEGPVLECADVAIWLRMTFASMYHLPFYLTAYENGRVFYAGHFGFIDSSGTPLAGYPRFKTAYTSYESTWHAGDAWPSDADLRAKHVGSDDSEENVRVGDVTLGASDGAGAYFDELFLNKRVGHLMVLLDGMFGSINLAEGVNMFHVKPEAITPGDVLLERWAAEGIGHTLPIMTVNWPNTTHLEVSVASGSMPRRQPAWADPDSASFYFQSDVTGGVGYGNLGGGLRRWRTPIRSNGRWTNIVPIVDRPAYISDDRIADIEARPAKFATLLQPLSPEERRDTALAKIEEARTQLRQKPASCSRRTEREGAFEILYKAMADLGKDRAATDAQYRKLEDYVFAELKYTESKTCCWNSTTPQMAEIILDFATKEKAAADAAQVCKQPTVFKATAGGYDTFSAHATKLERAADWKAWSEDEPCAQRATIDDVLTEAGSTGMCQAPGGIASN